MRYLTLRLGELPPGPNDSGSGKHRKKGLLNAHHISYSKLKNRWKLLVRSAVPENFEGFGHGPVELWVARFSLGTMDRDNLHASMKPVIDGLVHANVIADDQENVIPWPKLVQFKVKSRDQVGLVVHLQDMDARGMDELEVMRSWAARITRPLDGEFVGVAWNDAMQRRVSVG